MSTATSSPPAQPRLLAAIEDARPTKGAAQLGFMFHALTSDPGKLRILVACTLAVVATVFEPQYLTLSTSFIQAGLRTPDSQVPMIFSVAFLILAVLTLIAGTSADLFGRRLFLLLGLGGLMLSNVLGLFLLHTPQFVLIDILNTITGVVVLPTAVAIVTLTFEPVVRPLAYGILFGIQGTAVVISPLIIPLLGGIWDGRATFIPALLIGTLALVWILRHVPESRAPRALRRGSVVLNLVLIAGMFVAVFLFITARFFFKSLLPALMVVAILILFGAVVRWLARRWRHFKGLQVYSGRDLGFAILAGVMLLFAQGCFFYQITPFFYSVQKVEGLAGVLRYAPYVIGLLLGGLLIARLALRFGARRILVFSFVLMGLAMLSLSRLKIDSSYWVMLVPITLIGLAAGLGGPARTQVVLGAPPEGLVSQAAAVNTAAGQAGYSLGVILSSVLVTQYADRLFLTGLTAAGVPADIITRIWDGLHNFTIRFIATVYPELPEEVTRITSVSYANAFTSGMTQMFMWVSITMFVIALMMYAGMHRGLRASLVKSHDGSDTIATPPPETQ